MKIRRHGRQDEEEECIAESEEAASQALTDSNS